jgi:hypothetical protein
MEADMTDRELLELAAKAAGISPSDGGPVVVYESSGVWLADDKWWNPLTDDGAALRLAVKLNLQVAPDPANSMGCAWLAREDDAEPVEETVAVELWRDSDPYAATRRAIVRAAAEIGRSA